MRLKSHCARLMDGKAAPDALLLRLWTTSES